MASLAFRTRSFRRESGGLFAALALLSVTAVRADQVLCHYTYVGETQRLLAPAVASPYGVRGIQIGSRFELRVVFQDRPADLASIKIYTYARLDDQRVLIHQASFPYPPARHPARHGFSGLHFIYEPVSEAELQYWCEMTPSGKSTAREAQ